MDEIFYQKKGRRYIPVRASSPGVTDSFPAGAHLVVVNGGWESTRYNVDPDYAGLRAAFLIVEPLLAEILREKTKARIGVKPTPAVLSAWEKLMKASGGNPYTVEIPSIHEAIDAIRDVIMSAAKEEK